MPVLATIFSSVCTFLLANKASIGAGVIANATYDALKKALDFSTLKKRIGKFFASDDEVEEYLRRICEVQSNNPKKPFRDVEDAYEELTATEYNDEIHQELSKWVTENAEQLNQVSKMEFKNEGGFNIGNQNAGQNIFNIQGDYQPNKSKNE